MKWGFLSKKNANRFRNQMSEISLGLHIAIKNCHIDIRQIWYGELKYIFHAIKLKCCNYSRIL